MKLYRLTPLGEEMAASPRAATTPAHRAICYMRRMQGPVSIEELRAQGVMGRDMFRLKMNPPMIEEVGNNGGYR